MAACDACLRLEQLAQRAAARYCCEPLRHGVEVARRAAAISSCALHHRARLQVALPEPAHRLRQHRHRPQRPLRQRRRRRTGPQRSAASTAGTISVFTRLRSAGAAASLLRTIASWFSARMAAAAAFDLEEGGRQALGSSARARLRLAHGCEEGVEARRGSASQRRAQPPRRLRLAGLGDVALLDAQLRPQASGAARPAAPRPARARPRR